MTVLLYSVVINDTHSDIGIITFSDLDEAVAYARNVAQEYAREPSDIDDKLTDEMRRSGWAYYASYSPDSHLSVRVHALDDPKWRANGALPPGLLTAASGLVDQVDDLVCDGEPVWERSTRDARTVVEELHRAAVLLGTAVEEARR